MNIEKLYRKEIDDLLQKRGSTVFHITGIRHCDYKDKADAFIEEAAISMATVIFLPEKANQYDHEAVSCLHGSKLIGHVATYDLEKYHILAEKEDADHLSGHFGRFSANVEDHLLKLYMPGTITMDEISDYRKNIDKQKDALYGSWQHDAIDHYLVQSDQQRKAIACICQLKERVLSLFDGHGTSTRKDLTPILDGYIECSQYDISLEGQRDRWDILLYLDLLYDHNHRPGQYRDAFFEGLLKDVEDLMSQIGCELVRSVSYKSYIERLKELVTKHIPSSEAARHYLNTLPPKAFDDIRQQVESFPLNLCYLFHTNLEEFVRTIYYARIPRRYLDPFLSGIALVEAYDKNKNVEYTTKTPVLTKKIEDHKDGIIDYWLSKKDTVGTKAIFESYYELCLKKYEKAHEFDDDAWKRDLEREFICRYHIPNEKNHTKESEALLTPLPENIQKKARSILANYLKYVRTKRKELYPANHPANRIIEDTFLDAYRMGGPAYECMSWIRTEFNLPYIRHFHEDDKTEKDRLSDKWKDYHENIIPEYVAGEFEDFDDGVLIYSDGGLMDEIHENIKACQTQEDRIRYIITLLQPFKEFADAFYSKARIDQRERSIKEREKSIEYWKGVPENAIDVRTGEPLCPQKQISACIDSIESYKKDIEYWKKVENEFFQIVQRGLDAEDHPLEKKDEMCKYLGGWWRCMLHFARRLAALVLTYGIKLEEIQENCEVYLMWHFTLTDYIDNKNITSIEHVRKLLNKIDSKKQENKLKKDDSDFVHIKDYQDNVSLDYYLSEEHWNFHVNTLLYRNLLVFYEGKEVGAFLDTGENDDTHPIIDYTPLYGRLFNEAYRICYDVMTIKVPDTKIAQLAKQAATWKFKNLKDENEKPLELVPNVIDLIESYHILGMANTILTLANDQTAAVDRFLIALSVYKDNGLYFCGFTHRFEHYNRVYETLIITTMVDGTYLRPGYDNKSRDEYLRRNLPWYGNFAEEYENNKQNIGKTNLKNIQEQNNENCNVFNSCQVFIDNNPPSSRESKPKGTKHKKQANIKPNTKPQTLQYYTHGNNGVLMKQRKRVDIVFKKWNEWGWIDDQTTANDFDAFFEGAPKHCNIIWTGNNTTVLTILLQELLKQDYIQESTGLSAKSLVTQQFGKSPNSDKNRLDVESEERIKLTLLILDTRNPLPEQNEKYEEDEYDTRDEALKEIFAGQLHDTKAV